MKAFLEIFIYFLNKKPAILSEYDVSSSTFENAFKNNKKFALVVKKEIYEAVFNKSDKIIIKRDEDDEVITNSELNISVVNILLEINAEEAFEILYEKENKTAIDELILAASRRDIFKCIDLLNIVNKKNLTLFKTCENPENYRFDNKIILPFRLINKCLKYINSREGNDYDIYKTYRDELNIYHETFSNSLIPISWKKFSKFSDNYPDLSRVDFQGVLYILEPISPNFKNRIKDLAIKSDRIIDKTTSARIIERESVIYIIYYNLKKGKINPRHFHQIIQEVATNVYWQDEEIWKSLIRCLITDFYKPSLTNDPNEYILPYCILKEFTQQLYIQFKILPTHAVGLEAFIHAIVEKMKLSSEEKTFVLSFLKKSLTIKVSENYVLSLEDVLIKFYFRGFEGLENVNNAMQNYVRRQKPREINIIKLILNSKQRFNLGIMMWFNIASLIVGIYLKHYAVNAILNELAQIFIICNFSSILICNLIFLEKFKTRIINPYNFSNEYKLHIIPPLIAIYLGAIALFRKDIIKEFLTNHIVKQENSILNTQINLQLILLEITLIKILPLAMDKFRKRLNFNSEKLLILVSVICVLILAILDSKDIKAISIKVFCENYWQKFTNSYIYSSIHLRLILIEIGIIKTFSFAMNKFREHLNFSSEKLLILITIPIVAAITFKESTAAIIKVICDNWPEFINNDIHSYTNLRLIILEISIIKIFPLIFNKCIGPLVFSHQEAQVEKLFPELPNHDSFISKGKIKNLPFLCLQFLFVYNTNLSSIIPYLNEVYQVVVGTAIVSNIYMTCQEVWNNRAKELVQPYNEHF